MPRQSNAYKFIIKNIMSKQIEEPLGPLVLKPRSKVQLCKARAARVVPEQSNKYIFTIKNTVS